MKKKYTKPEIQEIEFSVLEDVTTDGLPDTSMGTGSGDGWD